MTDLKSLRRKVTVLHSSTPIREAAGVMCDQNIGCILVVDQDQQPVGIVSDRDVACAGVARFRNVEEPISEIMTSHLITAEEKDDLHKIIQLMQKAGIRRIPIVKIEKNHKKTCVGIITVDDLIAAEMISSEDVAVIIRTQIQKRTIRITRTEKTAHDQTLNSFYLKLAEKVEVAPHLLVPVTHSILGSLIQRLHYTGAARLTSLLPRALEEELLEIPAGPNRAITVGTILNDLISQYKVSETQGRAIIFNFFAALEELLPPEEIKKIKVQLPEEFQALFIGAHRGRAKKGHVA